MKINAPSFESSLLKDQKIEKRKKISKEKLSRRNFLKLAGATTLTMVGSKTIADYEKIADTLDNLISFFQEENESEIEEVEKIEDIIQNKEIKLAPEEVQEQEDYKNINEIFKMGLDEPIEININNSLATQKYWEEQHSKNPKYVNSLKTAFKGIEKYEDNLKKIFKEEEVPEKFMYLAIPESYWNWKKRPGRIARGPYQFTKGTGRKFGLKIDGENDERFDPLKSGRACAKYLKYLYKETGNWDLALAGYNGGLIWGYLKHEKQKKEKGEISYENFLAYMENQARKEKEKILKKKHFSYRVRKKDTIWRIAKCFKVNIEKLKKDNNIGQDNKIKIGQKLKISFKEEKIKEIYKVKMNRYIENLNYPPKFNAVIKLINEGFIERS